MRQYTPRRYTPRLYVGERPTLAALCLRWCAEPGGYKPPYFKRRVRPDYHNTCCYRLHLLGLAEERKSGPRGGKRWHATERGQTVLKLLDESPDVKGSLLLLGLPRAVIGKKRLEGHNG